MCIDATGKASTTFVPCLGTMIRCRRGYAAADLLMAIIAAPSQWRLQGSWSASSALPKIGTLNRCETPSTALRAPSLPLYLFTVAQIFNLPYRRFVIGKAPVTPRSLDFAHDPQVTNLRYSRLQVCATSVGNTLNRYPPYWGRRMG